MTIVAVYELSNVTFSGTPFASDALADPGDVGTTFTINDKPALVDVVDNDGFFEDADGSQQFSQLTTLNGSTYGSFTDVENEYSYVVRPAGAPADGSEDVTIYAFEVSADVVGFASDGYLEPGVTYTIIAIDSNDPSVAWSSLHVCFRAGSLINTQSGIRPIELLRPGDRVETADHGFQPVIWTGLSFVGATGAAAPVRIGPRAIAALCGKQGPSHTQRGALFVSPQHNLLVALPGQQSVIVPAKALVGWLDVQFCSMDSIGYCHVLLEEHALLNVGGLWSESFNPGPVALRALSTKNKNQILNLMPQAREQAAMSLVRPRLGPSKWRRFAMREGILRKLAQPVLS